MIDLNLQVNEVDQDDSCVVYEVVANGESIGTVDHIHHAGRYRRGKFASVTQKFRMNRGNKEWGNYWTLGDAVGCLVSMHLNGKLKEMGLNDLRGM